MSQSKGDWFTERRTAHHLEFLRLGHEAARKHGMYKSPEYFTWSGMIQRCTNPKNIRWKDYGGRGITVCARWRKFENFLEDMGKRPAGHSIDRIDNDKGYEPGNCRWVEGRTQRENRRNTCFLTLNGERRSVNEWASILGVNSRSLYNRIRRGWGDEKVLTTPIKTEMRNHRAKETTV